MAEKVAPAAAFTRVVSRSTSFVDRISRDAVEFVLVDGNALELRVNKAFAKRVSVLRVHPPTAQFFDQDDWLIAAPHHQFARVDEKLRALAGHIGIPAFTIVSTVEDVASFSHNAVTRGFTYATLSMPRGTGTLRVSWGRPAGTSVELLEAWPAVLAAADGTVVFPASVHKSRSTASRLVGDTAAWISARASAAFVVVDAACVEGQVLVNDALPKLRSTSHAAIVLVPTATSIARDECDEVADSTAYSGAAAGYSTALALQRLLSGATGTVSSDQPSGRPALAMVDADVWPLVHETLLPVLRELLPSAKTGGPPLCFPQSTLARALGFLSQVRDAYEDSRPYVHAFIGAGALEADVREAVVGAARAVAELGDKPAVAEVLGRLEHVLLGGKRYSLTAHHLGLAHSGPRPTLVPVGAAAGVLVELLKKRPRSSWQVGRAAGAGKAQQSLILLDMTDAAAGDWLQCMAGAAEETTSEQSQGSPSCFHVLALLPEAGAPHVAWDAAAPSLAKLMGDDDLELGLALGASVNGSSTNAEELVGFVEALASACLAGASFHNIAFQLRPGPRTCLCLPARIAVTHVEHESSAMLTLTGTEVAHGAVSASFSLWPSCAQSASVGSIAGEADGGLMKAQFLRSSLAPDVMRAGVCYDSQPVALEEACGGAVAARTWHICCCGPAEAVLYRRAAGDFEGRSAGAFQWQGGEDGPCARLWELASELDGDAAGQAAAGRSEDVAGESPPPPSPSRARSAAGASAADGVETSGSYSDDQSFEEASEEEEEAEQP